MEVFTCEITDSTSFRAKDLNCLLLTQFHGQWLTFTNSPFYLFLINIFAFFILTLFIQQSDAYYLSKLQFLIILDILIQCIPAHYKYRHSKVLNIKINYDAFEA